VSREDALLQLRIAAYRDGELSRFERWLFERRLRRDPAAQRALAELDALGTFLRETDAAGPEPDLWESIRLRLPAADARLADAETVRSAGRGWRGIGYLALGAAAAGAAALALFTSLESAPVAPRPASGSVRWIDSRGHPMMVLRDDAEATIIWVPESEVGA
jgi:anti-sigma factor RsiW